MMRERKWLLGMFALYALVGVCACVHGVMEHMRSVEDGPWGLLVTSQGAEGVFPKVGARFYEVAADLVNLPHGTRWSLPPDGRVALMNALVVAQVLVYPLAVAVVLVCATLAVRRWWMAVR